MEKNYTPWDVFILAITLMIAFMGGLLWRVENVRLDLNEVRIDVAVVKNDTAWIKKNLEDRGSSISLH